MGSDQCKLCHSDIYEKVTESVHGSFAKDAAENPDVVPGDFSGGWPKVLGFNKEDVRFVLLAKPGLLKTTELVGQKGTFGVPPDDYPVLWAAVDRETGHWVIEGEAAGTGTPWLSTCAGCHVTGLQVRTQANPNVTASFVELGITCEHCHGPASEHVRDPFSVKPVASTDATTCGQCHQRGASVARRPDGRTFGYPLSADGRQYVPGDDLAKYYRTANPKEDPGLFWPNGLARNSHHMQYPEWLMSGHANALTNLKASGHASDRCLSCHSADAIVNPRTTLATAKNGVTCQACHDSHNPTALRVSAEKLCGSCHNAGGPVEPGKPVHHPNKEMYEGAGVPGVPLTPSEHFLAGVTCQDCHMPKVTDNPHKGSHLMRVVTPAEGLKYGMPDSCTACHKASREYMQARLDRIQQTVEARLASLKTQLDALAADHGNNPLYLEAKLHYDFIVADGSRGFHNPKYTLLLLDTAEEKLAKLK